MMKLMRRFGLCAVAIIAFIYSAGQASAALLLYEPFDYTAGDNLGGTDPDGAGPTAGTPIGQTNLFPGGGTWYARGTASNYQAPNDTLITSGNLSYSGLAASQGNSVSYGSAAGSSSLYANSIPLPSSVSSGPLYASFIIKIKSNASTLRHSPAGFVTDVSNAGNAGTDLSIASGTATTFPASFWMRRDPVNGTTVTNFSPSKSSGDGIGPAAVGPSAGYQHSVSTNIESNQFGAVNGQALVDFNDSGTYQTYFVVLKYTFDHMATTNGQNDTVSMWMNPGVGTLGSATGEADASQAATGNLGSYYAAVNAFGTGALDVATSINSFALVGHRQNQTESIAVEFDELRIGTTWAAVTPAIPEPASLWLCFVGVFGLSLRRSKKCCA